MPYIRSEDKIKDLPKNAGELTYAIQQVLKIYLEGTGLRYAHIAEVLGALEGAKLDFVERIVKPYENQKRMQNGDVWPLTLTAMTGVDE